MQSLKTLLGKRAAEIKLAIRVTVAATAAYGLAYAFGLPQGYWAVITAILVMQTSIGASLKAAIDRLGGTLAGAAFGAIVALLIPHDTPQGLAAAIALAIAPTALLAALKVTFKVAPVTALIVMFPTAGSTAPVYIHALDRILEISLGNVVGIAVALLVLPARAHTIVAAAAARVARLNADLLAAIIEGLKSDQGRPGLPAIHAKIRAALKQLETVADEAGRERKSHLTDLPDPEPLVRTLYRVRHDLIMIGRTAAKPLPEPLASRIAPRISALREAGTKLLWGLADALGAGKPAPPQEDFEVSLRAYAMEMEVLRKDGVTRGLAGEDASRVFALRFSLEQLSQDLRDLGRRIDEMAGVKGEAS